MYQNIYFDIKKQQVHIWDDEKGYYVIPYKRYAYVKDRAGTHVSLYGDKLHLAHNAEVFLGTPRYYNLGLTVNF